jgi:hypothetical protein
MTPGPVGCSDAGRIGTQVARAVIKAGHPFVLRNYGPLAELDTGTEEEHGRHTATKTWRATGAGSP